MMYIGPAHWVGAFAVALAVHIALVSLAPAEDAPGAVAAGEGDVGINLSMVAARTGSDMESAARDAQTASLAEASEVKIAARESVREDGAHPLEAVTTPEETPVSKPLEPEIPVFEPVPAPEPVVTERPAPGPEPKPDPLPATAEAKPLARPAPPRPPEPEPEPAQAARPAAPVQPTGTRERSAETSVQASLASRRGGGRAETGAEADSADPRDAAGGSVAGEVPDRYAGRLRAWLERHKTYPVEARRRRMEGVVYLYFRAARDGQVVTHEIRKSSGFALLDRETEELLQRAQPLPSFTSGMNSDFVDVVVPIDYTLRRRR